MSGRPLNAEELARLAAFEALPVRKMWKRLHQAYRCNVHEREAPDNWWYRFAEITYSRMGGYARVNALIAGATRSDWTTPTYPNSAYVMGMIQGFVSGGIPLRERKVWWRYVLGKEDLPF